MIRWNVTKEEWSAAEPIRRWVRESDKALGIARTIREQIMCKTVQTSLGAYYMGVDFGVGSDRAVGR